MKYFVISAFVIPLRAEKTGLLRGIKPVSNLVDLTSIFSSHESDFGYNVQMDSSCFLEDGSRGIEGVNYDLIQDISIEECTNKCESKPCFGYEYKSERTAIDSKSQQAPTCHLWKTPIGLTVGGEPNHVCSVKVYLNEDDFDILYSRLLQEESNTTTTSLNTTCPSVAEGYCPLLYQPVVCGDELCEYSNFCFANLAGYNHSECTEKVASDQSNNSTSTQNVTCPSPAVDQVCILLYEPVICGTIEQCEYSNNCFAELAGYNSTNCLPKCPHKSSPSVGYNEYNRAQDKCGIHNTNNPVVCGSCTFENLCIAQQYGTYDPSECQLFCPEFDDETITAEARAFPIQCQDEKNRPVICGENRCVYDNLCLATVGARFDQDQCTQVEEQSSVEGSMEENCSTDYPTNADCDKSLKPVQCYCPESDSDEVCNYPNLCFAIAAGWDEEDCARMKA